MIASSAAHPPDNGHKCPKCDTELRDDVLGGQCPLVHVESYARLRCGVGRFRVAPQPRP
ncbi:MAG: hypothetical protein ACKV19_28125 [Verrucomicrobiales bacterium]